MILIDVNLLIYAVNEDAPLYRKAKPWLETTLSGTETVCLSWSVVLAFLRPTTRAGIFRMPLTVESAFEARWKSPSRHRTPRKSAYMGVYGLAF